MQSRGISIMAAHPRAPRVAKRGRGEGVIVGGPVAVSKSFAVQIAAMATGVAFEPPVKPAGGQWLWSLLGHLRQSTVHGGGATTSQKLWVTSPSGSASALAPRVSLTATHSHRVHGLLRARRQRSSPSETWR